MSLARPRGGPYGIYASRLPQDMDHSRQVKNRCCDDKHSQGALCDGDGQVHDAGICAFLGAPCRRKPCRNCKRGEALPRGVQKAANGVRYLLFLSTKNLTNKSFFSFKRVICHPQRGYSLPKIVYTGKSQGAKDDLVMTLLIGVFWLTEFTCHRVQARKYSLLCLCFFNKTNNVPSLRVI